MSKKFTPEPVDVHVGSRVRFRRKLLGMSQSKLGEALGLTFQQIQKYESGANRIGSSRLYQLSQILGTSIAYFFDEMDNNILTAASKEYKNGKKALDMDKMGNKETADLLKNYYSIEDKNIRKNITYLIRSLN
jgi:transcriptional regulator with XRE-family HTH domain